MNVSGRRGKRVNVFPSEDTSVESTNGDREVQLNAIKWSMPTRANVADYVVSSRQASSRKSASGDESITVLDDAVRELPLPKMEWSMPTRTKKPCK